MRSVTRRSIRGWASPCSRGSPSFRSGISTGYHKRWSSSTSTNVSGGSSNRNSVRAVRVREVLGATDVDLDAITAAIRYPMRRIHLGLVLWLPEQTAQDDDLVRLERFLRELTESLQTQGSPLFVAADRVSAWGWIPLHPAAAATAVGDVRRFVAKHDDSPVGCARFAAARRRRIQAVAQAGAARTERGARSRSRRGVGHRSGRSRSRSRRIARQRSRGSASVGARGARPAVFEHRERRAPKGNAASVPTHRRQLQGRRPTNSTCTSIPSNTACNGRWNGVADRSATTGSTSNSPCCVCLWFGDAVLLSASEK